MTEPPEIVETTSPATALEVLVLTGMSGAGRSTAANALEDMDWYVVDNLPPQMIAPLVELVARADGALPKVAVVADVRARSMFSELEQVLVDYVDQGIGIRVLFLDASDEVLVRRFESVRRPHPLQGDGTLIDGIEAERRELAPLRNRADITIDTSDLNVHQLRAEVRAAFGQDGAAALKLTVMSFGFKYGIPKDADHVVDVRFLPNPYWIPHLRGLNGQDAPVSDYVLSQPGALSFVDRYLALLDIIVEGYLSENRSFATIAIGCTGGKHRSVAIGEQLARRLADRTEASVSVRHRDLGRE
ncbi:MULTISPECIES: RNase adapter RapZ [unclassified Brevibacterium]|uniref:RNase adapter RapZ n=1 Tax=unclassified Brevibacterium TaxID=2614124 RepID=UPI0010C7992C|nr:MULTISPECIES: RNase adapter RapZ [unclassified Brevibacterium]MCK1802497.1 RNase adapter RapZ [Brevibacterium sp. R8603A2]QCP05839.1 RNase adapter RapZ [Brevibacterium sp. CS2]